MTTSAPNVWGIHTGRPRGQSKEIHRRLEAQTDHLFNQGYVALGWPQMDDLRVLAVDRESFKHQYQAVYGQNAPPRSMGADVGMLFTFVHGIREGDVVVWRSLVDRLLHIGVVTGPYLHRPTLNEEYHHLRPVKWRAQFETRHFSDVARNQLRQPRSLFRIVEGADEYRRTVSA